MVKINDCQLNDFLNRVRMEKSSIIAFGAGRKFREFVTRHELQDRVDIVLDNNVSNGEINIKGKVIKVINPKEALIDIYEKTILLITNSYNTSDILKQLDSMQVFDGMDCYICPLMLENISNQTIVFQNGEEKIPRIIHYCWFGGQPIPYYLERYIESWHKVCGDYEIKRWDESNYDISKNKFMLQAYEAKKWGFVPDYARLDIIYQYGGVYLDTDVELIRSLDPLLKDDCFMGFNDCSDVALGLGFGAKKNCELIYDMMNYYDDKQFVNDDGSYNMKVCSEYQNPVLNKWGFKDNGLQQNIDGIVIYPMELFNPSGKIGVHRHLTDNTFSIHHSELSYESEENKRGFLDNSYIKERLGV